MKINKITIVFSLILAAVLSSCTKDGEYDAPKANKILFAEDFSDSTDNQILNTTGWTNISQTGTKKWSEQVYKDNGYAEFSSYGSGQAVNVAWLISPTINMDAQEGEKLVFQSAQNFLKSRDNTLELFVSTDYDGANFATSSWINLPAIVPTQESERYTFINSGVIDLSSYTGTLHFAFKVKGSGTNTNLTGTYQVDNIRVFY